MQNCQNSTIAIIDSGIGGLSILKQLINKYHCGNYIYYADNLYIPYGNKSKKWLENRIKYIIEKLRQEYNVRDIIIACNTASTCLKTTDLNVKTMQFEKNKTYFATELTQKNLPKLNIIADETLAKQIENNILNQNKMKAIIKKHIIEHKLIELKEFVLGCTHYELVDSYFRLLCKNSNVLKNSEFILKNLNYNFKSEELNIVILMSKKSKRYEDKIKKVLEII